MLPPITYTQTDIVKKIINPGSIVFCSSYEVTVSSAKHLEDISQACVVSLLKKLISSLRGSDDPSSSTVVRPKVSKR